MKKFKLDRVISIATLVASVIAIFLVLKKPAPVSVPQAPAAVAANAQSFEQKLEQLEQASQQSQASAGYSQASQSGPSQSASGIAASATPGPKAEVRINSDEIGAVLAQSLGMAGGASALTPDSNIGGSAPTIKDQHVSLEGDVVHGQFLTEIAGKDVWITVSGHIGEKDGYATFDPTEFKVGDLNVPVSLVNPALQRKLAEERDRLKLPNSVGGMKVENGELVMQQK
ncbi:MAG: hypothetical protein DMG77_13425 [Acidobacteria bacterium]|nr:MAG: hypothetical protein DMG77_13425 [Acidobacteriota bacterium]